MLETLIDSHDHVIIVGDLNAKHTHYGCQKTDKRGDQLFDFVERNSLVVINDPDQYTRHVVSTGYKELLDYAIVTRQLSCLVSDIYVGEDFTSDHLPVHIKLQLQCKVGKAPIRNVRVLSKCNWKMFAGLIDDEMVQIDATELPQSEAGIDEQCTNISMSVNRSIEAACPRRDVKDRLFRLSEATLTLIRQKRKLRRKSQTSMDPSFRTLYNNMSRQVSAAIKDEKRKSWEEATESLDEMRGCKFWQKFKTLTGVSSSSQKSTRIKNMTDVMTSTALETADVFASCLEMVHLTHEGTEFCSSTRRMVESAVTERALLYSPQYALSKEKGDDSDLIAIINVEEVERTLSKCRSRTSPGEDGIGYNLLKKCPLSLFRILARIYSTCLTVGYFPKPWKAAVGVMIPKKDKDSKVATNYRPISLLNTIGKLFEKIVATRMHHHFRETHFFNQWQRAYLAKKEGSEHLHRLGTDIKMAKSRKWTTSAVSLDVEKAFDSVWHDGLRYKLSHIDLPVKLVRLLSSFLTNRTIRVRVEHEMSQLVYLRAGTPQGSVLSPLLFLIYVNDLPIHPSNKCQGGQFADDLSLWTSDSSKKTTGLRLQRALKDVELWCSIWRIKVNPAKTQLVCFTRSKKLIELKLFGKTIKEQSEMTLLGITFDKDLYYKTHCNKKAKDAARRCKLLRMVSGQSWGANSRTLLSLYKQYIRPVLEYGNVVLADAVPQRLKAMQSIQNGALRTALQRSRRTTVTDLHTDSGIEPIKERLKRLQKRGILRFGDSHLMRDLNERHSTM